jgi:hypothetical protein
MELGQRRADLEAFDIEHQALGILHGKHLELQLGLRFQRDARVVLCRPDTRRDDLRLGPGDS